MRKSIIIFIIASILLAGIFSLDQNFSRLYHHTFSKLTDLSKENVEGVYLGDKIDSKKIVSKYGDNYYTRLEQGTNIIGYVDKDYSIEFWLVDNRVVFYRLDYKFME